MDEGRKRVLGIMAAILASRKLAQLRDGRINPTSPAFVSTIADAVHDAAAILQKVEREFPSTAVPKSA